MPYRKFKETIRKNNLIQEGDRVLVAFSGGPDSTVLLHFLFLFSEELGFSVGVAHLNHGLRRAADSEEEFCRKRSEEYELPFFSKKVNAKEYAKERGLNIEEASRELRYRFLEEIAEKGGYNKIATGHTLSDQAETLLYRLMRGSGISGLSGIHPLREGLYIRPLLQISRDEIMAFLKKTKIPFIIDPSNTDLTYDRNWIRHKLIPVLKKRFPAVEDVLAREALIFLEEDRWIEKIVQEEIERRASGKRLKIEDWEKMPIGFRRRLVRGFLRFTRGNLRRINFDHIEHIVNLTPGEQYFLPGDERIMRLGNSLFYLGKLPEFKEYELEIPGEGEYEINGLWKIKVRSFSGEPDFSRNDATYVSGIRFPVIVRNWKEGDRYIPIGKKEPRKLSNIFNSRGIPGPIRKFIPVFISGGEIFWAYMLPAGEKFKFTGHGFIFEIKPLLDIFLF